ncbi:glucan 1,4-alpha-glucosidase [Pedobacter frigiditerrae]|uniref:Glucan 1,4-alpha-glucosidase n=1 Tax=Pedobacter frigiditerrae TaxID=2530452 RepID=A0A4R0MP59_9SPHI|nr:glycoside hydrolase family 3 C-terminal domain-containing protein [Pedobacter frigiditerrae]TCC88608.1 glucan 1,4-alpha-glucosidase [Pedobacter frigiditerrae]
MIFKIKLLCCGSILASLISLNTYAQNKPNYKYNFQNPNLSVEERVNDLVSHLTLEQKIAQMCNGAPGIDSLGILPYNWWSEGLHGICRSGIATVFPQAIGLSATWNDGLHQRVADIISSEFRAKYNEALQNKEYGQRYKGLTIWSPNINIFRDPRWGRGQETYGEDPYLTGRFGVAFVKGLQGDNPTYLKTVATPKHYAVHSGPEALRHVFDAQTSARDFWDTYAPAFEACIKEGKAWSVMSAYNRYMGEAATASPFLLQDVLRDKWGFKGYVVSDCDGVADIYKTHKLVATAEEASALAVKGGCDLNCGNTYKSLTTAVEKGLITEKEIDISVKRLFTARIKLGMFDPTDLVPYNKIPANAYDLPEHRKLALESARQSMVLLKNNDHTLPLSKNTKNILVVGPNANAYEVLLGNYNGIPSSMVNVLDGIKKKMPRANITYLPGCDYTSNVISFNTIPASAFKGGIKAEYFQNQVLKGTPKAIKTEKDIDFNYTTNGPADNITNDNFSARFTGQLFVESEGDYNLGILGETGFRLFLDDVLIIDHWPKGGTKKKISLKKGLHNFKLEYFVTENVDFAELHFQWARVNPSLMNELVEAARKNDVVVFAGGISPQMEGEGGTNDRKSILLPELQTETLKKLHSAGKPIVLVLMSGSALTVNWENANLPAILQAWYPGEEGGTAVADVLFGDYNPAGRMPVTVYKSDKDLPDITDYNMKGRTYRYFEGETLYPFGYGLSYSNFTYSNLSIPKTAKVGAEVTVTIEVQNTGKVAGDEVVQVYIKDFTPSLVLPIHSLQQFRRVHLKAGEKQKVSFVLTPKSFSHLTKDVVRVTERGSFEIAVGGQQPNVKGTTSRTTQVLSQKLELTTKN